MVKQLEVSLYRSAPSFEAYADITNLKSRLQYLAMEVAKKRKKAQGGGDGDRPPSRDESRRDSSGGNQGHVQHQMRYSHAQQNYNMGGGFDEGDEHMSSQHGNPNDPDWKVRIKHKQQRLLLLHHSSKCHFNGGTCHVTPYCGEMKQLWKHMAMCTDNECRVPHCFSSRSILSHYRKCKDPGCPACGPVRETVRKAQKGKGGNAPIDGYRNDWLPMENQNVGGDQMMDSSSMSMNPQMNKMHMNPQMNSRGESMNNNRSMTGGHNENGMPMQSNNAFPGHNNMSMGGQPSEDQGRNNGMNHPFNNFTNDADVKAAHKRHRLLLLRHASKCSAPPGHCKETNCAEMKVLWKHIATCREFQCPVRHCMSSRYVLSHYRRCKGPCDTCDPVRDAIDASKNGITAEVLADSGITQSITSPSGEETMSKKPRIDVSSSHSAPIEPAPASSSQSPRPSAAATSEEYSLLECFTTEQVQTHLQSLKHHAKVAPAELKSKCIDLLKELQTHEHGWVFASPVNPVELGLDDYFDIIKKPMDFGTIQKNLEAGTYHSFDDFKSDVRLTFENAMKYNEEKTPVHEMAKQLKKKFEQDFKKFMKVMEKEHAENSKKVQACGLCGCEKLLFEPPVWFCNGMNCPSKRIRRNHNFYITADKQYAWCNQCFNELDDNVDLGTTQVKKVDLNKRKNDETHEESWVQCDDCERWIHQICGLYNTRQDKENKSAYSCPLCVLDRRKKHGEPKTLPPPPCAEDLPRTKLSEWLEKAVHEKVVKRMKELATEKAETEVRLFVFIIFFI
jgi:E1A/CREB-binding protein